MVDVIEALGEAMLHKTMWHRVAVVLRSYCKLVILHIVWLNPRQGLGRLLLFMQVFSVIHIIFQTLIKTILPVIFIM